MKKVSKETREKMSEAKKGHEVPEEVRKKISDKKRKRMEEEAYWEKHYTTLEEAIEKAEDKLLERCKKFNLNTESAVFLISAYSEMAGQCFCRTKDWMLDGVGATMKYVAYLLFRFPDVEVVGVECHEDGVRCLVAVGKERSERGWVYGLDEGNVLVVEMEKKYEVEDTPWVWDDVREPTIIEVMNDRDKGFARMLETNPLTEKEKKELNRQMKVK